MTTKKHSSKNVSLQKKPGTLILKARTEDEKHEAVARAFSKPEVRAASAIQAFDGENMDINFLVTELKAQNDALQAGNLTRVEAMLGSQAHTLDAFFTTLARWAHTNLDAGFGGAAERWMRLALKAQAQCVRTIEALVQIKNPKQVAYVAQANISNGHQQVNNCIAPQKNQKKWPSQPSRELNEPIFAERSTDSSKHNESIAANPKGV